MELRGFVRLEKITNGQPFDYADVDGFGSNANAYINLDLLLKYRLSSASP